MYLFTFIKIVLMYFISKESDPKEREWNDQGKGMTKERERPRKGKGKGILCMGKRKNLL